MTKLLLGLVVMSGFVIGWSPPVFADDNSGRFAVSDYGNAGGTSNGPNFVNLPDEDRPESKVELTAEELERQRIAALTAVAARDRLCNGYSARPDGTNIARDGQG